MARKSVGKTKDRGRTHIHADNMTTRPNLPVSTRQAANHPQGPGAASHRGDRRDMNRVFTNNAWWGSDWEAVILKPWQFSSFNPDDPNSVKFPGDPIQDPAWAECLAVAEAVYTNSIADPTNGATHYFAASLHPQPAWAKTAEFKIQLGNHLFFKAA